MRLVAASMPFHRRTFPRKSQHVFTIEGSISNMIFAGIPTGIAPHAATAAASPSLGLGRNVAGIPNQDTTIRNSNNIFRSSSSIPGSSSSSDGTSTSTRRDALFKLFALDLETTIGGALAEKKIIELAIVPCNDPALAGTSRQRSTIREGSYASLVNPGAFFRYNYVSRISYNDCESQPNTQTVLQAVANMLNAASKDGYVPVLVAHNGLNFDFPVLEFEAEATGVPLPAFLPMDTLRLSKASGLQQRLGLKNLKQGTLIEHFGASQDVGHRALADAEGLASILPHLLRECTEGGGELGWQDLIKHALDIMQRPKVLKAKAMADSPASLDVPAPVQPELLASELQGLSLARRPAIKQTGRRQRGLSQQPMGPQGSQGPKGLHGGLQPGILADRLVGLHGYQMLEVHELQQAGAAGQLVLRGVSPALSPVKMFNVCAPVPGLAQQQLPAQPCLFTIRACRVHFSVVPQPGRQHATRARAPAWSFMLRVPEEAAQVLSALDALVLPLVEQEGGKCYNAIIKAADKQEVPQPCIKLHLKLHLDSPLPGTDGKRPLRLYTKLLQADEPIELPLQAMTSNNKEVEAANVHVVNEHLPLGRACDVVIEPKAWHSNLGAGVKLHAHEIIFHE